LGWLVHAISGNTFLLLTAQGLRYDAFFAVVNNIFNTIVIGNEHHPGQWDCPKDKTKREVGIFVLTTIIPGKWLICLIFLLICA